MKLKFIKKYYRAQKVIVLHVGVQLIYSMTSPRSNHIKYKTYI
jgi:hypothetical protein